MFERLLNVFLSIRGSRIRLGVELRKLIAVFPAPLRRTLINLDRVSQPLEENFHRGVGLPRRFYRVFGVQYFVSWRTQRSNHRRHTWQRRSRCSQP